MNTSIFKTLAFWLSAIPVLIGLLMAQGAVLSGSTVDHILGTVMAILGVIGGHNVAAGPTTPPPAVS